MADPAMGYAPTSPLIKPPPVVVIAAPAKIVKWAASPRKTELGPAAVSVVSAAIKAMAGQDAINGISQQAIGKQLVQVGAIVRTGNDGVAVVKKIDGTSTRVFYLRSDILTDDDPEPAGENEPEDSVSVTEVTTGYNFL